VELSQRHVSGMCRVVMTLAVVVPLSG